MIKKEKTHKKLKGIKPFNKFLFRSCYYHQLIAAYARYGISEDVWLMNYLPIYKFDSVQSKILIEELEVLSEKDIENITGLKLVKKKESGNIIEEIIRSIDKGMLVIAAVDCFYLDYREDTYKKQHISHFLLFYGYDRAKKKFIINEHRYVNSQMYIEWEVDFKVIDKCFKNYLKRLVKPDGYGIIKIKRVHKPCVFEVKEYRKVLADNKSQISKSFAQVKLFCDFLLTIIKDETILRKHISALIESIGIVRWKKTINKHQLMFIYKNEEITTAADKIVECLIFIYGILAKTSYTNKYNESMIEKLSRKINDYLMLEEKIHNFLLAESL